MTREIKFKVWCKENEEFIQFNKMGFLEDGSLWYVQGVDENEEETDPPYFENQNDWELMQYTGLKDKNGVEIYEGDIIKAHSYKPTTFKIEFIEGGFCATRNGIEYPIDINHFYPSIGCAIEVIGNIYEHPHLLEGE